MNAAVLNRQAPLGRSTLALQERSVREPAPGEVLLRVAACGVCRTDLHIVEGELPAHTMPLVPGHQIVGYVEALGDGVTAGPRIGQRVGVSWLGGTDGTCAYCRTGRENLCDAPTFTGYDVDGGYAEYVIAHADFVYGLPPSLSDTEVAPLLCAGIIGFRALRVAGVRPGERVGLYGFGASAHLALPVLRSWGCSVFVATRGEQHRAFAASKGADWVGHALERPPVMLDRAVTFAPAGDVVVAALRSLRKGGVVAINAIHLDRMPAFDYDSLLWGEREIRSVSNMTRQDGRDFLALAAEIGLHAEACVFSLERVNEALMSVKDDALHGAAVVAVATDGGEQGGRHPAPKS